MLMHKGTAPCDADVTSHFRTILSLTARWKYSRVSYLSSESYKGTAYALTSSTRRMWVAGSRKGSPVPGWRPRWRVLSEAFPSSITRLKKVPELRSWTPGAQGNVNHVGQNRGFTVRRCSSGPDIAAAGECLGLEGIRIVQHACNALMLIQRKSTS